MSTLENPSVQPKNKLSLTLTKEDETYLSRKRLKNLGERKRETFSKIAQSILSSLTIKGRIIINDDPVTCLKETREIEPSDILNELGYDIYSSIGEITPEQRLKTAKFLVNGVYAFLTELTTIKNVNMQERQALDHLKILKKRESPEDENYENTIKKLTEKLDKHFSLQTEELRKPIDKKK